MLTFIGHFSKDINVVKGKEEIVPGGGAYYGAFAARSLGEDVRVITKVAEEDRGIFTDLEDFGVEVVWLPSKSTTSIQNVYPSDNPDERESKMVSRADPFTESDIEGVSGKVHITPLWHGEFPEDLLGIVREKASFLSADAQGFLRNVSEGGEMYYRDWDRKDLLKLLDLLKVDSKEAEVLTGSSDPKRALRELERLGVKEVVLTSAEGVYLLRDGRVFFSRFGRWTMEGRTGRGDTCVASYLALRWKIEDPQRLLDEVARITTLKMKRKGPYKGWSE